MRLLFLLLTLLVSGCTTQLFFDEIPATPEHYFKQAQAHLGVRSYNKALALHRLVMINYPNDFVLQARATFANAQIYFTQKKYPQAAALYQSILDARSQPEGATLPQNIVFMTGVNLAVINAKLEQKD